MTDRRLRRPFAGWTPNRLDEHVTDFIKRSGLKEHNVLFKKGALLAQSKTALDKEETGDLALQPKERRALRLEHSSRFLDRFHQPRRLYALVVCCSLGAAVQGWDQTAVNGAQIYFREALGLHDDNLLGLVNGAPYLCCAVACCLNYPLNKYLDRRGVIFTTCLISSVTCLLQAFSQKWWHLFLARFALGFGIGPKSATIPIYAAEAVPENIRGALVMMWQMWTAFGIMCGYVAGVALARVGGVTQDICTDAALACADHVRKNGRSGDCSGTSFQRTLLSKTCSLNWRLMVGSPMILPLVVVAYVYTLPESPRVLIKRARKCSDEERAPDLYEKAFMALRSLRNDKVQAARDLFLMDHLLAEEEKIMHEQKRFRELFELGRCRRALTASVICMFLQQMCGVNVTAYYSSKIMRDDAGWSANDALLLSMGFGIINFVFAIPAIWTIDTFGRRNLLLFTFPFMALFQGIMVVAFAIENGVTRRVLTIIGMYLFGIAYSPGEGPVPFVYSSEAMPLYNRDYGMGIVTAINWAFNFIVSFTWPAMSGKEGMGPSGAFAWYAVWCLIGWWMILLFVPETKGLTLEQLDQVFEKPTSEYVKHGMDQLKWFIGYYIQRKHHLWVERPVFLRQEQVELVVDPFSNVVMGELNVTKRH
ncbi:uncharacterized protein M421DRAFT_102106 [Didymella exigua CBS 183.55]|uniref:Major facilitator superfamily (MFS) profile domain-containing protein n=1 Tax=Didymella exigua CBS 183.55 TaxID=1150837 RepID=A0A6A5RHQ3_9PLEO|nr:uncharacterized protein M421DRAFT_102106 [Didymella exigua CBS 183.55]KAF1927013.1 hypothetical protein M421DRAFT_102106 [Didymella exigua CBS 183.55]